MSRRYTGYPRQDPGKNPPFSRKEYYCTTNSLYGSHHNRPTSSNLKNSWERHPVRGAHHKTRPISGTKKTTIITTTRDKNSVLGANSSSTTTTSKATKASTSVTKPHHTAVTGNTTINQYPSKTKRSSILSHSAANHQSTGVNKGTVGGYPKATNTDVANPTDLSKAGKHQDYKSIFPHNLDSIPLTTTTATTTAAADATMVGDATSNSSAGGSHSINTSSSKDKHQERSTNKQETVLNDKLTRGGYNSSNYTPYSSRPILSTSSNNDPYHQSTNKSSGGSSIGNGYRNYGRHAYDSTDVKGGPSSSQKQLVKGLSNLGNTCFYNAVMQNLTVLVILYEKLKMIANSSVTRCYNIPGGEMNTKPLTVTVNTSPGHNSLTSKLYQFLNNYNSGNPNPASLLDSIGYKNTRFKGRSQQDSHELFRTLLDGIRTEEAELVRKGIDQELGASMDGETKLMKKVYRRNIVTKIDEVFGGKMCSIVICRRCRHVSHISEAFLDLSLPIVDSQRGHSKHRSKKGDKQTTTFGGVCELLQRQEEGIPYPITCERSHDGTCNIENCLSDYTDIEVMDDDNMFICTECNRRHQEQVQHSTGKGAISEPILSPVSKLLLIDKLPPVLVLHLKRFSIGYTVTKNSKHVSFSLNLNTKKYCTKQCKDSFNYRLKGVVSHSGSLNFGHYIAYVCTNNQWYYASDSHITAVSSDRVLSCEAYMLFYERT